MGNRRGVEGVLASVLVLTLVACGGGGGGDASPAATAETAAAADASSTSAAGTSASQSAATGASSGEGNALLDQASQQAGSEVVDSTSYWTMDGYRYVSGGYSQQDSVPDDHGVLTVVVVSTASMSGGTDSGNGAYKGGALNFSFSGADAGLYAVVPSREAFVRRRAAGDRRVIYVESQVGTGVTTGSTAYAAQGGRVRVTRDEGGKFHLSSEGSLPVARFMDLMGGVDGAPDRMTLTIHNAH